MQNVSAIGFDEVLVEELREQARQGVSVHDLIAMIKNRFGLKDGIIPVLGYICRAFSVPLPVVLPLREDGGDGPFARALQVCVWFSALVTNHVENLPWNWEAFWEAFGANFSMHQLSAWPMDHGELKYCRSTRAPRELFVRGSFEVAIDKTAALGFSDRQTFAMVKTWVLELQSLLDTENPSNGDLIKGPAQVKLDYQIEEQGPKYLVVCTLRSINTQVRSPELEAAAAGGWVKMP